MKKVSSLLTAALSVMMLLPSFSMAQSKATPAPAAKAAPAAAAKPTTADIAAAQAKGMVWVNTESKVYHKDGKFYGHTKHGQFMTEDDAKKAGFQAAKTTVAKSTPAKKPATK